MNTPDNIGIVGRGAIGSALGNLLEQSGSRVEYWDIDSNKQTVASLPELITRNDIIILAIPSWFNREIASQIRPDGNKKLVITLAKGTERGFVLMDEVLKQSSEDTYDYGVLYGPMLAEELAIGMPSSAVLAINDHMWKGCFDGLTAQHLKIEYSSDVHGVATCGVLKNIYAIALGIHDGLGLGLNAKGVLATKVFSEMRRVLQQLEVDTILVDGLAGVGDLLATGWSESSFNHRIGKAIAQRTEPEDIRGEGVNALHEIGEILQLEDFPIINMLNRIVLKGQDPKLMVTLID